MKHVPPESFEDRPRASVVTTARLSWRQRLLAWWQRLGWDRTALPETLQADVEPDHPSARPVRGKAAWERLI